MQAMIFHSFTVGVDYAEYLGNIKCTCLEVFCL